jgi:ribosomal protein S18 acetylase RimI-like enzyme
VNDRTFRVFEVVASHDLDAVRDLILAHVAARATTPGIEYMRADALSLPGRFSAPRGGLWLARGGGTAAGAAAGCVALRPLDDSAGEVKRMYVNPEWRGQGVGRALLVALIAGARERGYRVLRLGTLHDMAPAQALYESLGFVPIERYRPDELIDTRFFELNL